VYEYLNLNNFPASKKYEKYLYRNDSIIINSISVSQKDFDTTSNYVIIKTEDDLYITYINNKNKNISYVRYTPWGKRISELWLYPGDTVPKGQVFGHVKKGDYIEALETKRGVVDSSTIRHYYFSSFDSLVADYMVDRNSPPTLVHLIFYTDKKQKRIDYSFDFFKHFNKVENYTYFTYLPNGKLHRIYYFDVKYSTVKSEKRAYELANYTEYTYDSLGRKISMITRVVPDSVATKSK
jgi:hypothetical protein